ncbi:hypothetical protein DYB25_000378 [Aphanomyces astaci]|uniref:Uncharacterized protein n=1 Tax=Aphanomyces astaci TaxID=112090 RepID=A0A396ZXK2_APHAT|nr:hypothetical protein DYB25_000378 [Aphanomyces astaci]RHY47110.1 hypothetical protein DYB30_004842 [Aphanomyces astaci]
MYVQQPGVIYGGPGYVSSTLSSLVSSPASNLHRGNTRLDSNLRRVNTRLDSILLQVNTHPSKPHNRAILHSPILNKGTHSRGTHSKATPLNKVTLLTKGTSSQGTLLNSQDTRNLQPYYGQQPGVAYVQPGQYGQQPVYVQQPGVFHGGQGGHMKVGKHGKVKYKGHKGFKGFKGYKNRGRKHKGFFK